MKQKMLLVFVAIFWAELSFSEANMLPLCHADQLYSEYNYGGIWERDEDGEWVCNFWQFLPEGQNERPTMMIGAEESEEIDFYINPQSEDPELIEYYDDGE